MPKYTAEQWRGDMGDEKPKTEHEEFEACRDCGLKPEDFADAKEGERYKKWLEAHPVT